jgi:hypothetical protein
MSNEWYTPAKYIEAARQVMGSIDLDPASCELANQTVKATHYYSKADNGLLQEWRGNVWLNPPFGLVIPGLRGSTKSIQVYFMRTLLEKYLSREVSQAIALVFGTSFCMPWFEPFLVFPSCIVRHRIVFDKPDGSTDYFGYGNIFVYFGSNEQKFIEVFSQFGRIAKAIDTPRHRVSLPTLWEVTA